MKTKSLLGISVMVLFSGTAVRAAETSATVDKIKAAVIPGEIVLTGSEVKNIHDGARAREYRVCVKAEKEAAPMKLMYGGQEAILEPGNCQNVTGKKIDLTPAQTLTGSTHIVATFHRVKK